MAKFTMPYDLVEEIELRLLGTIIQYDGKPVYVAGVKALGDSKFTLTLYRSRNDKFEAVYGGEDDAFDLAPFEPGYATVMGTAYWVFRIARRMYQQGGNDRNTHFKNVGEYRGFGQGGWNLLDAYCQPPVNIQVTEAIYKDLIAKYIAYQKPSLALNNHLALGVRIDGNDIKVFVEYKGGEVGILNLDRDGTFFVSTDNESLSFNPWCVDKLNQAGIRVGA